MHHGFFEVLDKFQGNFTLSLCLHTLPPHHTRSVTSLPLSIFYRKTGKDLSLEGNTPSSTLHLLKETAGSIPLGNQWCVTPETPLEQPDPAPFHCCAAPWSGSSLVSLVNTSGQWSVQVTVCVSNTAGQASRQAQSYLLGRCEVWLLTFLPTGACSAFQHS